MSYRSLWATRGAPLTGTRELSACSAIAALAAARCGASVDFTHTHTHTHTHTVPTAFGKTANAEPGTGTRTGERTRSRTVPRIRDPRTPVRTTLHRTVQCVCVRARVRVCVSRTHRGARTGPRATRRSSGSARSTVDGARTSLLATSDGRRESKCQTDTVHGTAPCITTPSCV